MHRPFKFLALGDSYTIGEGVLSHERWPNQLLDILSGRGYRCPPPEIIARTGWRTDELKKAIEERDGLPRDYDMVSLLIGVNNQYQGRSLEEYQKEFRDLLRTAVRHAGGNTQKVIVLSIPDYGFTPFGSSSRERISREIEAFNKVNQSIALESQILYVDITDISRRGIDEPVLLAEDGLHPSGKMYRLWAERVADALE